MQAELDALHKNRTWELDFALDGCNIVGSKWISRIKRNPNGTILRYKARLVAKRFMQRLGT